MPAAFKSLVQWLVYGVLVVLAGGLILLGKADAVLVERVRLQVGDAVVPILERLSQPVDGVAAGLDRVGRWTGVTEENARLREERDRLLRWQSAARRLEAENAGLRQLLNFVPEPGATYRAARVVADSTGAFAQSVLVNAGTAAGVEKGQIVLTGEGLAGRIVGVSQRSARVLLLTDLNSRVPVFVGTSRVRAILAGDNSGRPKLVHVVPGEPITVGDTVVTSGIAGGFPPGLPVGVVGSVEDQRITVVPNVDRDRLEYVRLADYDDPLANRPTAHNELPGPPKAVPSSPGQATGAR